MRTRSLTVICSIVGTLAIGTNETHAQGRRRRPPAGGSESSAPAAGSTEAPGSSGSSGSSSASGSSSSGSQGASSSSRTSGASSGSSGDEAPGESATSGRSESSGSSGASARSGGGRTDPNSQVLVSNVINRQGYHATRVDFEIFGGVGPGAWAWPWGGFVLSPGIRFGFPLTRNGPHPRLNNDFRLVIGAQAYFSVTPIPYWWLSAPITLQWNFFLSEQWSVLLEAGIAVDVFTYDLINCYDHPRLYCDRVYFHPAGAFGLRRHLSGGGAPGFPAVSFRFTYPGGVQVGLSF